MKLILTNLQNKYHQKLPEESKELINLQFRLLDRHPLLSPSFIHCGDDLCIYILEI